MMENLNAIDIIEDAGDTIRERGKMRDSESGERAMKRAVGIFNAATGVELTEMQGWIFMIALKLARANGQGVNDDYIDICGYAALAGECLSKNISSNGAKK